MKSPVNKGFSERGRKAAARAVAVLAPMEMRAHFFFQMAREKDGKCHRKKYTAPAEAHGKIIPEKNLGSAVQNGKRGGNEKDR